MGANRAPVVTAALGFLCGAATTFTLVVVYQLVRTKRRRRPTVVVSSSVSSRIDTLWDHPDLDLRLIRKAEAVIQGRTDAIVIVVERCTNDHNYSAILRTAEALGIQSIYIIDPPAPTLVAEDGTVQVAAASNSSTVVALEGDTLSSETTKTTTTSNDRSNMPVVRITSETEQKAFADHRKFAQNATEWLTIREFPGASECLQSLRQDGYQVWVTDLSQEATPLTVHGLQQQQQQCANEETLTCHSFGWHMPAKIALVMGTEAVGCSQEMLVGGDLRVYLPLVGFADSLNLSVATALVIQQIFHLCPHYAGCMSEENRHKLRQAWFPKLAQQRLLSSRGKKQRKALQKQIQICERLETKLFLQQSTGTAGTNDTDILTAEQSVKLAKLPQYREELVQLESQSHFDRAEQSVADLIAHPPQPLTDVRRADPHRVTFVGKKTKRMHSDHWKDLVATTNTTTTLNATASFFRDRILPRVDDKPDTSAK